jgi:hypothetical protein
MSATKIAASFRVSLTALLPKQPDSRVAGAWAWLHFHAALIETRGRPGMQTRRFGSYPSRTESSITHSPREE